MDHLEVKLEEESTEHQSQQELVPINETRPMKRSSIKNVFVPRPIP